jgi:hypothetical protein
MIAPVVEALRVRIEWRLAKKHRSGTGPQAAAAIALVSQPGTGSPAAPINAVARDTMVREAANFRAQGRAFVPGNELEDRLAAEKQSDNGPGGQGTGPGET